MKMLTANTEKPEPVGKPMRKSKTAGKPKSKGKQKLPKPETPRLREIDIKISEVLGSARIPASGSDWKMVDKFFERLIIETFGDRAVNTNPHRPVFLMHGSRDPVDPAFLESIWTEPVLNLPEGPHWPTMSASKHKANANTIGYLTVLEVAAGNQYYEKYGDAYLISTDSPRFNLSNCEDHKRICGRKDYVREEVDTYVIPPEAARLAKLSPVLQVKLIKK